ncbi:MAG: ABC transporter substrate-binding protein/permease [Coriobacteriales bacterium]|jgi:polar amino acid transport system substrate-binding protein|nr:ABC transporter substrate-binding protein/permease [Coriobacteriales bacterium]
MRRLALPAAVFLTLILLCGSMPAFAADYTDYTGKTLGVAEGEVYGQLANDLGWSDDIHTYTMLGDLLEDVRHGRIDAGVTASVACSALMAEGQYTDLEFLFVPREVYADRNSAVFKDAALRSRFNEWAQLAREDGTLDEIEARWLSGRLPQTDEIPVISPEGTGETLVCAIATGYPPMAYEGDNGRIVGYEVELAERFAAFCNRSIRFDDMSYGAILPAIKSGKADFASMFSITDEREASVLFGESVLEVTACFIVKKPDEGAAAESDDDGGGFLTWLENGIENNLIKEDRYKLVLDGLAVTLEISLLSLVCGTVIGAFVCFLLTRKNRIVKGVARFYCGFIHGTPEVTLLMVAYYIVFGNTSIEGPIIAVAAFSLVCGAGVATNLSGAIDTVDTTEREAARALGFSALGTFMKITLPQAVRRALPAYTDNFVSLVKGTAVVGYIAIQDLTRATDIIRSRTFDAYFPVILSALIYLALTTLLILAFKFIINKVNERIRT